MLVVLLLGPKLRDVTRPPDGGRYRRQWFLLGKPLGAKCTALILGIGRERLRSACNRKLDERYAQNGLVVQLQLDVCYFG